MLQVHALNLTNLPTPPPCVHMCACVHSLACHVGMYLEARATLSVSVLFYGDGSLAEPRTRLVASKPQRCSCPFPQFWVTGVWLHPGELGWFGGGGGGC